MSYPLQPYKPNNAAIFDQKYNRPIYGGNHLANDLLGSLFGLATQLMGEILQHGPGIDGISPIMGIGPNNPHMKIIGVSSMNVTQIARGPNGRPHIIQAHDERRIGPDGIWQTKKALCDPDRGINKMQVGYFAGDRSEVIEHQFDQPKGQYQQEVQQRPMVPNQPSFPYQWPIQSQQAMQRQPAISAPQQYQYYPRQQQFPSYAQQPLQARATPPMFPYI